MKRILIINKSFAVGGIQRALVNLLKEINTDYEIDLMIFYAKGAFLESVPANVNIIQPSTLVQCFGMSLKDAIYHGKISQKIFRMLSMLWTKLFSVNLPLKIAFLTQPIIGEYDAAISFHHETHYKSVVNGFNRFLQHKVIADKKISWIHADVIGAKIDIPKYNLMYNEMDTIVAVSNSSMKSFVDSYPSLINKTQVCYNMHPINEIQKKSIEVKNVYSDVNSLILFSASRLSKEKGIIRSIYSISKLIKEGYDVIWYIAGDGSEKSDITNLVNELGLNERVVLLGRLDNPFPFMREADLVFVGSYHEAAPMVADEAMILGTPILSTDIPVIREKIKGDSGFVVENSEHGIYIGIKEILDNPKLLSHAKIRCKEFKYNNNDQRGIFDEIVSNK